MLRVGNSQSILFYEFTFVVMIICRGRFGIFRLYLLLIFFLSSLIAYSQERENIENHLERIWCFEKSVKNENSLKICKCYDDKLIIPKSIIVESGIAKIPQDEGLEGVNNFNFSTSNCKTFWCRFLIPSIPNNIERNRKIKNELFEIGSLKVFYESKINKQGEYLYGIGGEGVIDSKHFQSNPSPNINIPIGVWVQVAVTVKKNIIGESIVKIYSRSEFPDRNPNYWIYSGQIIMDSVDVYSSFRIGSKKKSDSIPEEIWLDEFRVYDIDLDLTDLKDIWPINGNYLSVSLFNPPGVVIDYSPVSSGRFIAGSPSLVILKDGKYLAKEDDYGPAVGKSELTRIYLSENKGETWNQISEIEGVTWASLFEHGDELYMIGTSAGHGLGHAVIVKSVDGGYTWTKPIDKNNGLIFSDLSYHTAPTPVIKHNGRIWKAMEDEKGAGKWGENFRAFVLSAPENVDLLQASNWTKSNVVGFNKTWLEGKFKGFLEGNLVITSKGEVANFLRISMSEGGGKAAIITYDDEGKIPSFNPNSNFIDFPGGSTKFHILFDEKTKHYWALSNAVIEKHSSKYYGEGFIRNTLVIMTSNDLRNWIIRDTILYHPDISKHAFQYPAFEFDGNDIIFVSRTSYNDTNGGAFNQHDANYFTFHRIKDFRKYVAK